MLNPDNGLQVYVSSGTSMKVLKGPFVFIFASSFFLLAGMETRWMEPVGGGRCKGQREEMGPVSRVQGEQYACT